MDILNEENDALIDVIACVDTHMQAKTILLAMKGMSLPLSLSKERNNIP